MNPSFFAQEYEKLPEEDAIVFLSHLQGLETKGVISIAMSEVCGRDRFPWEKSHITANVGITWIGPSPFYNDHPPPKVGAGWGFDSISAISHAAAEAIERIIFSSGGEKQSNQSKFKVYSLTEQCEEFLNFNLLEKYDDIGKKNLLCSRSGEAFHPVRDQALRGAFCEAVEREVIDGYLRGRYLTAYDITKSVFFGEQDSFIGNGVTFFESIGYNCRLVLIDNPWKVCVVAAVLRAADSRSWKVSFIGSGADFSVYHARNQAFIEMARYALLGEVAQCDTRLEAEHLLSSGHLSECMASVVKLALPEFSSVISPFFSSNIKSFNSILVPLRNSPEESIDALRKGGRKCMVVTSLERCELLPGFAFKVIIPGFSTQFSIEP